MTSQKICAIEGCGKPSLTRGWCRAHYRRWQSHGDPLGGGTMRDGTIAAFLAAAMATDTDDCITWPFATGDNGYGQIRIDGKTQLVHRVVCAAVHGPTPDPDHEAAHSCGRGHFGCINWRHLRWATPVENNADKLLHGTDNRGERHGLSKLSEADVLEIRLLKGAMSQREIGEMFGVAKATVCAIFIRRSWVWLEGGVALSGDHHDPAS